jgi:hypothetical protein
MNEGYITITVPSQQKKICAGCSFHSVLLVKSGYAPIYKRDCTHPDASTHHTNGFGGGNISGDYTPDWCPVGERKE